MRLQTPELNFTLNLPSTVAYFCQFLKSLLFLKKNNFTYFLFTFHLFLFSFQLFLFGIRIDKNLLTAVKRFQPRLKRFNRG